VKLDASTRSNRDEDVTPHRHAKAAIEPPTKRRRTSGGADQVNGHSKGDPSDKLTAPVSNRFRYGDSDLVGSAPEPVAKKLKKRVSFSTDTKPPEEDSDAKDATEQQQTSPQTSDRRDHPVPKKKRGKNAPSTLAIPRKSKDALDYLDQFYHNYESWKFNKNREIWIFKHVLSATDIPSSYNLSLARYVHGLKSQGARSRLIDRCRSALVQHAKDKDDQEEEEKGPAERQRVYHDEARSRFMKSLKQSSSKRDRQDDEDEEYQEWLKRQKREELLLWSLNVPVSSKELGGLPKRAIALQSKALEDESLSPNDGPSREVSKKRKQPKTRTAVVEYSSDSSSTSSSSSSDEEDGLDSEDEDEDTTSSSEESVSAHESSSQTSEGTSSSAADSSSDSD